MGRNLTLALFLVVLATGVSGQSAGQSQEPSGDQSVEDKRVLVEMPENAQAMIRQEMRTHMSSLQRIISALADERLDDAGEIASQQLGSAIMGRHRARGGGPGRYMPAAMRSIGMSMHAAADQLAEAAEAGEQAQALRRLGQITAACSACHNSYRIR
jgi:hypothetical protein